MTAPHPTLRKHYRGDDDRHEFVMGLFDGAAPHYDRINGWISFGLGRLYRRLTLQRVGLRPGQTVLDVATGTGLVAQAALDITGDSASVIGLDPSPGMLRQARARVPIRLVRGVGERLPFRDGRFDVVTMGYALRHVPDLEAAFVEYRRVLKPGGRVLLLEISRPANRAMFHLLRGFIGGAIPWLTRLRTRSGDAEGLMRYYWDTIVACVPHEAILRALEAAGFAEVRRDSFGPVLSEYWGVKR
ncbi:MAG: class I SAM-dependent methyltransferase [Candidatus Rokuibacteriota bacterium]